MTVNGAQASLALKGWYLFEGPLLQPRLLPQHLVRASWLPIPKFRDQSGERCDMAGEKQGGSKSRRNLEETY